jgi:threonine synthase
MTDRAHQQCINPACRATFSVDEVHISCAKCGSLLDIAYDWNRLPVPKSLSAFEHRWATKGSEVEGRLDFSGVWRFRELMPFYRREDEIVTIGEGRTMLQNAELLAKHIGMTPGRLMLQYEGLNPSGSFKDNGMAAAFTHAKMVGARRVACASTGNTSASLALFAALSDLQGVVFIGSGKISVGKLSQALDYGAQTLQINGDFDACLKRVRQIAQSVPKLGIYLMNSVNPFRLEGQKSIMFRILEALNWETPDWVIVPGGNLGNCSAFGKAFAELHQLGLIKKIPRLCVVNAQGANTLYELVNDHKLKWNGGAVEQKLLATYYQKMDKDNRRAHTIASAIEIGRPVNLSKALRALDTMNGVVVQADDETIREHRAMVARYGFGCEPASAASVAGLTQLLANGTIGRDERVVCILTGHELKDPNETVKYHTGIDMKAAQDTAPRTEPHGQLSNRPILVDDSLEAIVAALGGDPSMLEGVDTSEDQSHVPVKEY